MHQRLRHIIILLSILQGACGLFFLVEEEESKCFIQTTPGDTMVLVKFAVEEHDQQSAGFKQSPAGRLIHLEVRDEDGLVFLSRDYGSEGHITFTAIREGDNKICFRSNRLRFWESDIQLRVHLDIKLGHNVLDNKRDMKQLDLDYMQLRVLKLQHQAEQIKKESNFQRYQEQVFRDTSQSIYYHLLFWSYFQLFILVIIFMIQSSYLRKKSYLYGGLRKVIHEPELAMVSVA
ncbi:hypothetical protein KR009_001436 [Drosophila setifemur]|nr:hypothetical protein KR009_001436 [Drosophila setifemur]